MAQLGRAGIFGGTFDPPHKGHIAIARQAQTQLDLDEVWWIPAGDPPHKQDVKISSVEHRFEMVRHTLDYIGNPSFKLLSVDRDRPGPHYMVDTVQILKKKYQGVEIVLLIGEDSLFDLPDWEQPQQLIREVRLAVFPRQGIHPSLTDLESQLPGLSARVIFLKGDLVEISSTYLRGEVQRGHDLTRYVVPEVARYIETCHLYS